MKTGGVYLGFHTLRGRKFPYGNFRTSVFCEVKTQIVGKTIVFRQSQSTDENLCSLCIYMVLTERFDSVHNALMLGGGRVEELRFGQRLSAAQMLGQSGRCAVECVEAEVLCHTL